LVSRGLGALQAVFESREWQDAAAAHVERELAFIMLLRVGLHDCFIRGRMDAVVPGDPPRVIDYKFAQWKSGGETGYEIQMIAYSLALMKSLGVETAVAELWYLKSPMKILRTEYTRAAAEERLSELLDRYLTALRTNDWPMAERDHCDAVQCGFREKCWG
jgi:CRISPR/Cas system-associated exonuclease Cas4 (RecB family)